MDKVHADRSLTTHSGGRRCAADEDGPSPLVGQGGDEGQQELERVATDELLVL